MAFDWLKSVLGSVGGGIKNLFGLGGGGGSGGYLQGIRQGSNTPITTTGNLPNSSWSFMGQGGQSGQNALGKLFGSQGTKLALGGLGMLGSQMVPNPKPQSMPDSYNQLMSMMRGGGTPGMQQAQNYYGGVLSGQNKDMYEAATHSLDMNYQEQLRQLNSMYKSLRPGTDPTTDSAYQRDLANLNDQYSRARAQTMAQVQQGAAQGMAGLGQTQMTGMMAGIQPQLDLLAQQWQMDAAKRQALTGSILGLGQGLIGSAFSDPQEELLKKMFPGLAA